jgi:hypothetical protein
MPETLILDVWGAPVNAGLAAAHSASTIAGALQAANPQAAMAALVDAPAYIADGFLNGQYTLGLNLPLPGATVLPGCTAKTSGVAQVLTCNAVHSHARSSEWPIR